MLFLYPSRSKQCSGHCKVHVFSGPLLESCTKETLDDFRNCQTLANIGSSSFVSVGEGLVFYAIPIFRSEFTADLLEKNLLDSERELEALRQSCSIPCSVGMHLVHHEELPSEPPKGHVMFYTQILLTLGVKLPLHPWLQRMLSFIGYAPGQLNPGFWDTLIGFYIIWMKCGLVTRGNIKLSGRELADVEKVLRVPKEDRHLGKLRPLFQKYGFQPLVSECQRRASKKGGTSTNKRKAPMLVPVDDILFHKGARKHREVLKITASKRAEVEAIECAATIVAGEERRLLPPLPTIEPIFPSTMKSTDQEGDPSSSRKRKYKEEVGSIHWKDLKVAMQPSSFRYVNNCLAGHRSTVMIEYDDKLREVERYKAKFKENNQLVNDARKTSKALAEAIRLKDQHFESLKRRNGENVRLKKQLEGTKKQSIPTERDAAVQEFLGSQAFQDVFKPHCIWAANFEKRKWMAILERYDNGSIIQKYRDEMDEYRQRGEAFVLAVDPSSEDDSDNEASVGKQSQESEDGSGDTKDGGDGD
ncbi:hypothetical protein D8674_017980 [Pyrus ussuriensis x Pyrus communis]|uniref:Uncharacterized protein n=1 Tax=Pyrus ussuriensis x Pyrus communis TaxID=2448454 RepID=A0A5N5HLB2_9ROSA|nr:hypothetical protein D8674_017980 [Pyrus ussuriensis x Pyrus communis]